MQNQLVFIEPNMLDAEPFTTSKIVAEVTGVSHRYIKKQISQREKELNLFGLLVAHATESTGGRPEEITRLNEQQATLLMTFLKNTPAVVAFKTELVRQFYRMRKQLIDWRVTREKGKVTRRALTDAVRDSGTGRWTYKHLTDLSYKAITGKDAAHLRIERGATRTDIIKDYLTPAELEAIEKTESQIAVLLDLGMSYEQIKATILSSRTARLIA